MFFRLWAYARMDMVMLTVPASETLFFVDTTIQQLAWMMAQDLLF